MSADVYAVVESAIGGVLARFRAGGTAKPGTLVRELSAAAVDALAGMGDVSDGQIKAAAERWDDPEVVAAVRALIAQARATDQARIAELEAIRRDNEVRLDERVRMLDERDALVSSWADRAEAAEAKVKTWMEYGTSMRAAGHELMARAEAAEAERDALRAPVERVRALADEAANARNFDGVAPWVYVPDLRAALSVGDA
jgi:hypothetical protein